MRGARDRLNLRTAVYEAGKTKYRHAFQDEVCRKVRIPALLLMK
jgi:hypothetical protein